MRITVKSKIEKNTHQIAALFAREATAGDVYLLEGELGAGKTTFAKGFAKELGIQKVIKSPTYTLIREYLEGKLPLYHMDLYRLTDEEADELGLEEYFEGDGVSLVEWASQVPSQIPENHLLIQLIRSEHPEQRQIIFSAHGKRYEELLSHLKDELIDLDE